MSFAHGRTKEQQSKAFVEGRKFSIMGQFANGGQSSVAFELNGGRIQCKAWIHHPEDHIKRPLKLSMDMKHWVSIYTMVKAARSLQPGEVLKCENLTGKPQQKQTQSMCIVGRNPDGFLFISIFDKERKQVAVPIMPDEYVNMYDKDGGVNQAGALMDMFVITLFETFHKVIVEGMVETWLTPQERQDKAKQDFAERNKGGGGGGYQNNNNGGGGYQQKQNNGGGGSYQPKPAASNIEDDIMF